MTDTTLHLTTWPPHDPLLVTDAGLETWLIFHRAVELPAFAAYPLVADPAGRALLTEYYEHYLAIARSVDAGVLLEAPTWRANPDWAATLGHDQESLRGLITDSIGLLQTLRRHWDGSGSFVISGTIGPRGDGYRIESMMDPASSAEYHSFQIGVMAQAGADLVTALTMSYVDEAIGICRAAEAAGLPAVISFTLETDGRLPSGMTLGDAIEATDRATGSYPTHYMVNCAHPTHFDHALPTGEPWVTRVGGVRANASTLSHAELDEMVELDDGDPHDLAARYVSLRELLPSMRVVGGCCGTDERHVAEIVAALRPATHSA